MSRSTSQREAQLESRDGKCSFTTKSMLHLCFTLYDLFIFHDQLQTFYFRFQNLLPTLGMMGRRQQKIKVGHRKKERDRGWSIFLKWRIRCLISYFLRKYKMFKRSATSTFLKGQPFGCVETRQEDDYKWDIVNGFINGPYSMPCIVSSQFYSSFFKFFSLCRLVLHNR